MWSTFNWNCLLGWWNSHWMLFWKPQPHVYAISGKRVRWLCDSRLRIIWLNIEQIDSSTLCLGGQKYDHWLSWHTNMHTSYLGHEYIWPIRSIQHLLLESAKESTCPQNLKELHQEKHFYSKRLPGWLRCLLGRLGCSRRQVYSGILRI